MYLVARGVARVSGAPVQMWEQGPCTLLHLNWTLHTFCLPISLHRQFSNGWLKMLEPILGGPCTLGGPSLMDPFPEWELGACTLLHLNWTINTAVNVKATKFCLAILLQRQFSISWLKMLKTKPRGPLCFGGGGGLDQLTLYRLHVCVQCKNKKLFWCYGHGFLNFRTKERPPTAIER